VNGLPRPQALVTSIHYSTLKELRQPCVCSVCITIQTCFIKPIYVSSMLIQCHSMAGKHSNGHSSKCGWKASSLNSLSMSTGLSSPRSMMISVLILLGVWLGMLARRLLHGSCLLMDLNCSESLSALRVAAHPQSLLLCLDLSKVPMVRKLSKSEMTP